MLTRRILLKSLAATALAGAAGPLRAQAPARPKRIIVDSQMHLWKANSPERPWTPGSRPQIPEPMTIERALAMMDEAGVDRLVVVPPSLEGDRVDYGQEAARLHPGRFATMGRIDLADSSGAARIAVWRDRPAVLGVRLNFGEKETRQLNDGSADWFWPAAAKAKVPVMYLANAQAQKFATIAERNPDLTLIVDHMGVSSEAMRAGKLAEAVADTATLAKYPNVSVKLSSIPLFSKEAYPFRDVTPHIKKLYDAYGPQRCHWGTDATNSFAKATHRQRVTQFTEELAFLSEDDKDWIMGRSILERLRWA